MQEWRADEDEQEEEEKKWLWKGIVIEISNYVDLYLSLLHAPPLRFHFLAEK